MPFLTSLEGLQVASAHFAERHQLVVIVALGESIVVLGVGAAGAEIDLELALIALLGLMLGVVLVAAGLKKATAHPLDPLDDLAAVELATGTALFVAADSVMLRVLRVAVRGRAKRRARVIRDDPPRRGGLGGSAGGCAGRDRDRGRGGSEQGCWPIASLHQ